MSKPPPSYEVAVNAAYGYAREVLDMFDSPSFRELPYCEGVVQTANGIIAVLDAALEEDMGLIRTP